VFHERVERLAESPLASCDQILGHTIAHEIGYLLLEPESHSHGGIMRANWDQKFLEEASCGQLLFTWGEARIIRADVQARRAMSEAGVTRRPTGRGQVTLTGKLIPWTSRAVACNETSTILTRSDSQRLAASDGWGVFELNPR
jgi:hypothetical protein